MNRIAVLGESPSVDLYGPAGALVVVASGPNKVRRAWRSLPEDVGIVVLTARAAAHLDVVHLRRTEQHRLLVVMP